MQKGEVQEPSITVLKPSTGLSLGLVASILIPLAGIFSWMESTYVRKEAYVIEMRHISNSLNEIKASVKELPR